MTEAPQQQPNEAPPEATPDEQPDTFPREYVEQIRSEAAEARTALKAAQTRGDEFYEALKARTAEQAASGILHSAEYLPAEDERYYDEQGFPSVEGYQAVAREVATARPYLGTVAGDVSQGAREQRSQESFGDLLRAKVGA